MREAMLGFPGPQIHVDVEELTLPGPAGDISARHYRPPGDAAAPLLVFYHGGGGHSATSTPTTRSAD